MLALRDLYDHINKRWEIFNACASRFKTGQPVIKPADPFYNRSQVTNRVVTYAWKKLKAFITSQRLELLKRFLFKQFRRLKNYLASILYKAIISKPCLSFWRNSRNTHAHKHTPLSCHEKKPFHLSTVQLNLNLTHACRCTCVPTHFTCVKV